MCIYIIKQLYYKEEDVITYLQVFAILDKVVHYWINFAELRLYIVILLITKSNKNKKV